MSIITVRPPASLWEYQQACRVVEEIYLEHGIIQARPILHATALIVAVKDGEIVGSAGLRSGDQGWLPTEIEFGIDGTWRWSCRREQLFEVYRIVSSRHRGVVVLKAMIAAYALYTRQRQVERIYLMTMKPQFEKAINRFCYMSTERLQFRPAAAALASDVGQYFLSEPRPWPITIRAEDADRALSTLQSELDGRVTIDMADFDHYRDYSCAEAYRSFNVAQGASARN
jgi:hypothetical protein